MPELPIEAAHAIDQYIKDLAKNDDPLAAFHAQVDFWDDNPGVYDAVHDTKRAHGLPARNPGPDGAMMARRMIAGVGQTADRFVEGIRKERTQKAIAQDRFAAGVRGYDEAAAVQAATSDGGAAWQQGVAKREGKIVAAMTKLAPLLSAVSQTVQAMPQDNEGQREARMITNLRAMREVGVRFRGG